MAIIYTYPETKALVGDDLLVVSKYIDDTRLVTNSITLSTLASYLNSTNNGGTGTNSYVTQWADGVNGILEDSPAFTFDGGAGLKQFVLTDGYRFVVDRDAATTLGDPEYAITQNGVAKTSFGWDDDGGGFGFLYNWAGKGFKIGSTTLYPQFEILTDATIKNISNADFEFEADIIDIAGNVGSPGNVLSSLGTGNGVQWVDKGSGTTDYFVKFTDGPNGVIGDVPGVLEQAGEVIFQQDVRFDDVVHFDGGTVSSFQNLEMLDGAAVKFVDTAGPTTDAQLSSVAGSNTLTVSGNAAFNDDATVDGVFTAEDVVFFKGLDSYADDAAAAAAGVAKDTIYQTNGLGAAPLDVAGILMVKQ